MKTVPVNSSNLKSVRYFPKTKTLKVNFHGGRCYTYEGVEEAIYKNLIEAESVGQYFNANIKSDTSLKVTKLS